MPSVPFITVFHPLRCAPDPFNPTLTVSMTGAFASGGACAQDAAPAPLLGSLPLVSTADLAALDSLEAYFCCPVCFSALFEDAVIGVFARCSGLRPELTLLCVYFLRTPTPTLAIAYPSNAYFCCFDPFYRPGLALVVVDGRNALKVEGLVLAPAISPPPT